MRDAERELSACYQLRGEHRLRRGAPFQENKTPVMRLAAGIAPGTISYITIMSDRRSFEEIEYQHLIDKCITWERFARYKHEVDPDITYGVCRYAMNLKICASLYLSLSLFEVALRNRIHLAFTAKEHNAFWFDTLGLLRPIELEKIREARLNLLN